MDPNLDTGTDQEQPADDIRSSLAAAIAESEAAPGVTNETPADGSVADAGESKPERARGPDGKFLKKDEAEVSDAGAAPPQADKNAATAVDPAVPVVADSKEPPAHWSAADKETFKTLPEQGQKFVLDRVKAMEGDYTRKTQEIANLKREYGPVEELFAPHKDVMRQKGFTPRSIIEAWANVEAKLASGPESAVEVIRGLVHGYSIPPEKLAAALGLTRQQAAQGQQQPGQQPTATENGQPVALPPEVARELQELRQQVGQFGQKFQTIEQREAAQRRAIEIQQEQAAEDQVNQFRSAKDENGNLLHPHMDEVEALMTSLAHAALASKQPVPSLQELYETAVYANPSTREKVLTAQKQQEEKRRTDEAKAKAANARKAGSSVTGAPGPGQAPNGKSVSDLSLREQLEAAADEAA
jgi:hypothetical protein